MDSSDYYANPGSAREWVRFMGMWVRPQGWNSGIATRADHLWLDICTSCFSRAACLPIWEAWAALSDDQKAAIDTKAEALIRKALEAE